MKPVENLWMPVDCGHHDKFSDPLRDNAPTFVNTKIRDI